MNWLDIVILVVLAVATFGGMIIGLIGSALFLVGIIVGVMLAGHYYLPFSQHLGFISSESVAQIVAFAIILVGVMLIALVLALVLRWGFSLVRLSWLDRLGGAVFGLAAGLLFCGAVLAIWVKFVGIGTTVSGSALASFLLEHFPVVLGLLPAEFDTVRSFFESGQALP
ncbi:MAG: CvpA family protein [Dehalococcoidia bacterium]|jgi:membrane protein required for colicin V production